MARLPARSCDPAQQGKPIVDVLRSVLQHPERDLDEVTACAARHCVVCTKMIDTTATNFSLVFSKEEARRSRLR